MTKGGFNVLITSEYVDLDGCVGRVAGQALVDAGVPAVGALHQQVDRRHLRLLSDHLKTRIK